MDGIINVLKPPGMTSHDVVNVLRRLSGIRRTGHTGTLDPGAAGVLPVCVGKATRVSEYVLEMDKTYRAELLLGRATDTEDASGATVSEMAVPSLGEQEVTQALECFLGSGTQIPPMYSAVRMGGKKLYELAREGKEITREPRKITVYDMELVTFNGHRILFDVTCSRGTYVRTLCREIAEKLGTVGHMTFLLRTAVGPFLLDGTRTLEELATLAEAGELGSALLPPEQALIRLPKVTVDTVAVSQLKNGLAVKTDETLPEGQVVKVYDPSGKFLAIATVAGGTVKPKKVF